jgi:FkbM family methyltransferase
MGYFRFTIQFVQKLRKVLLEKFSNNKIVVSLLFYRFTGLNKIDKKLRKYLTQRNGYFVELGANDGLKQSNTKHFELFRGWSGILIEPELTNFNAIKQNRSIQTKSFHCACVSFDFKNPEISLIYSDLMTILLEGSNEIENVVAHAKSGERFWRGVSYEFKAPARTLTSVLEEARSPNHIDFLSLDVEGAEIEVLRGLDFTKFTFGFLLVESRGINLIENLLNSKGYKLVTRLSSHDYLFEKNVRKTIH